MDCRLGEDRMRPISVLLTLLNVEGGWARRLSGCWQTCEDLNNPNSGGSRASTSLVQAGFCVL